MRAVPALLVVALLAALVAAGAAAARPTPAEVRLAETYAPVMRLSEPPRACEESSPYQPTDVDAAILGNDEVALRGPWDRTNIVAIGPTGERIGRGLWGYHLDFPGDPLQPGCSYEEWELRLRERAGPTAYARVVTEAAYPGRLALQYWFFYVFNDWNNTHEGDWEMIQLNFDAATPEEALAAGPVEAGYSQHSSAERAEWGGEKLELVDGTHPVVYPSAGSGANFFQPELHLMRSELEGVGCDNTTGPHQTVRPRVRTVPTDRDAYLRLYPWLGYEGRWGERQVAFFNGPTGPNDKTQWTEPFTWAETRWRDTSFAVPAGGALGTQATDIFCGAIERGSLWLRDVKTNPGIAAAVLGGLAVLLLWGLSRTAWGPVSPLPAARGRRWGQLVSASLRLHARHPRVFLGIGLLFVPLALIITLVQFVIFHLSTLESLLNEAGERNAFVGALAFGLGLVFTLAAYGIVQAATAWAVAELDAGRRPRPLAAYRAILPRLRGLIPAMVLIAVIAGTLTLSLIFIPVAVWLLVRWSLAGAVAGTEGGPALRLLRRSAELARGRWWRMASILLVAVIALLLGPAIGVAFLIFTGASFDFVNLIAGVVYVAAVPLSAVLTTYLYYDLRERRRAEPAGEPAAGEAVAPA